MKNIDPTLNCFLGDMFAEADRDATDPLQTFLDSRAIAGELGGNGFNTIAAFKAQVADIDRQFASRFTRFEKSTAPAAAEEDETLLNATDHELAKNAAVDGRSRRLLNLRKWIRSQLALGESVGTLEKHAREHDAETADLILEAARGL